MQKKEKLKKLSDEEMLEVKSNPRKGDPSPSTSSYSYEDDYRPPKPPGT